MPAVCRSVVTAAPAVVAALTRALRTCARPSVALASDAMLGSRRLPAAARRCGAWHLAADGGHRGAAAVVASAGGGSTQDVMEVEIKVDGMVCDSCSSRVQETLEKVPGVKKVHVDLEKGLASVEVEAASQVDAFNALPKLVEAVAALGFEACPNL
eukprot:scaffold2.g7442.t1